MNILLHTESPVNINPKKDSPFFIRLCIELASSLPENQFFFLAPQFDNQISGLPANIKFISLPRFALSPISSFLWYTLQANRLCKHLSINLLLSDNNRFLLDKNIPQFLLANDRNFQTLTFPHSKKTLKTQASNIKHLIKKSSRIFFSSEVRKQAAINLFPSATHKATILYPFLPNGYKPAEENMREEIKQKWCNGAEYFFCSDPFLSTASFLLVLKAFSAFKKRLKSNMKLIIAADKNTLEKESLTRLSSYRFKEDLVFCSSLTDKERASVIACSYGMLFLANQPELYLPILEAILCGTPSIVTDTPLCRELGGDHVLYYHDQNDLAQKMMLLYKDEEARNHLINKQIIAKVNFSKEKIIDRFKEFLLSAAASE